jgi:anti-sigma regulatory factor (Ser/Thr protein kinase)
MPEMDGLELVAEIKNDYPHVPVILMTGAGSEDIAARALRAGAASYVPKKRLAGDLPEMLRHVLIAAREASSVSRLMHHLTAGTSTFVLNNDLQLIRSLVSHLQQQLRCLPLGDETERLRVGIAVEEALKNAYYHGNLEVGATIADVDHEAYDALAQQRRQEAPYRDRRIHVDVRISRAEAVYVIRDEGPGFDTSKLLESIQSDGNDDEPAGRGVILMRSIMDEVQYNDAGNEVTLIKRRAPQTFEDEILEDEG